jgi:hypothetical protein
MGTTCSPNGQRQTVAFNFEISTAGGKEGRDDPSKYF